MGEQVTGLSLLRFPIDRYRSLDNDINMPDRPSPLRHRDTGMVLVAFGAEIWVRCPRCAKAACARYRKDWSTILTCGSCGFSVENRSPSPYGLQRRFTGPIRCEGCGGPQPVRIRRGRYDHEGRLTAPIRCRGCGHEAIYPLIPASPGDKEEGRYLGLPLFLSEPVGGHMLWPLNPRHLDELETWLETDLRERPLDAPHTSMMERLPQWLKGASARGPALRAIGRMRSAAAEAGIG